MIAIDCMTALVTSKSRRHVFRVHFPESWIEALTPQRRQEFETRGEPQILVELGEKPPSVSIMRSWSG
jgi:hypothetical protein